MFNGRSLQMGPYSFPSIEHYWSTNKTYNVMFGDPVLVEIIQLLLPYFHLGDNPILSSNRLYKVRPLQKLFNNIMRQNYVPNKNICIDESMLLNGRLFLHQFLNNKNTNTVSNCTHFDVTTKNKYSSSY